MADINKVVFAIFKERPQLETAVTALKDAGFRGEDISVLFADKDGTKDFAHEKATKAPEGATAGGSTGAIVGGGLGWLTGIGALTIPGLGPFLAAGPLVATLAGVGVGGAIGGIAGALTGMGMPEYEAKRYEGRVKDGGILISVHCDKSDWVDRAESILRAQGGADISSTSEDQNIEEGTDTLTPRSSHSADLKSDAGVMGVNRRPEDRRPEERPLEDRPLI